MRSPAAVPPILLLTVTLVGCSFLKSSRTLGADPEFRGVFVATAYNIDWPSKPGLHQKIQTDEIHAIVKRVRELNCNVIFLQVRAFGDRIHRKTAEHIKEPWSVALNRGNDPHKNPKPDQDENKKYDPLGEWLQICHEEQIQLHAWVNPFRVRHPIKYNKQTLPTVQGGSTPHIYLYPESENVRQYVLDVVEELADYKHVDSRQATLKLDGILFDHNWLPPSRAAGDRTEEGAAGGTRQTPTVGRSGTQTGRSVNVNPSPSSCKAIDDFVERVSQVVRRKGLKFGISPDGASDEARNQLRPWIEARLVDYVVPELYSSDGLNDFSDQLNRWLALVPKKRADKINPVVMAALGTYRTQIPNDDNELLDPKIILAQIQKCEEVASPAMKGYVHYCYSALRSPAQGGRHDATGNVGELIKKPSMTAPASAPATR